jgi:hypothetical protein
MSGPSRSPSPEASEFLEGLDDNQLEALERYQACTQLDDEEAVIMLEGYD